MKQAGFKCPVFPFFISLSLISFFTDDNEEHPIGSHSVFNEQIDFRK